jgi:hypothetical protein
LFAEQALGERARQVQLANALGTAKQECMRQRSLALAKPLPSSFLPPENQLN